MLTITTADRETLAALAGTLQMQHDHCYELIQRAHAIRAHLAGASGVITNILKRAEERARPGTPVAPHVGEVHRPRFDDQER